MSAKILMLPRLPSLIGICVLLLAGCVDPPRGEITVLCGVDKEALETLIDDYQILTRLKVHVEYGASAELARSLIDGTRETPVDVFISDEPSSIIAVNEAQLLGRLTKNSLKSVPQEFSAENGHFIGLFGQRHAAVYNPKSIKEMDAPDHLQELAAPAWKNRLGWAPRTPSFQSLVTMIRSASGEAQAKAWLEAMIANAPKAYSNRADVVNGVRTGDIDIGLVHHNDLHLLGNTEDEGDASLATQCFEDQLGSTLHLTCGGVLRTTTKPRESIIFLDFLLSDKAQKYFAERKHAYPTVDDIPLPKALPSPPNGAQSPAIGISELGDHEGTRLLLKSLNLL